MRDRDGPGSRPKSRVQGNSRLRRQRAFAREGKDKDFQAFVSRTALYNDFEAFKNDHGRMLRNRISHQSWMKIAVSSHPPLGNSPSMFAAILFQRRINGSAEA